jgi:serine/threonine-protein kinase
MNTPSRHSPLPPAAAIAGGRYLILRELGSGGMGVVYLCEDTELGRQVAVKTLVRSWRSSKDVVSMFLSEARALAGLDHPGLVRVHDVLAEDEAGERVPYLVMEYIKGSSLESLISERALPLSEALRLLAEVADALAYCHGRGLLHRDVKPANILVTAADAVERADALRHAKLIDFGIARSLSTLAQRGTELRGTPAYMAPEQVLGARLSPATDLYALGVTIFEAVSGELPFTEGEVMAQHVYGKPPSLRQKAPGIPRSLERLVMRCLAKEPSERPADCAELRDALLRIVDELVPSEQLATRLSPVRPTERRLRPAPPARSWRLLSVGLGLSLCLVGSWLWLRRPQPPPAPTAPAAGAQVAGPAQPADAATVPQAATDAGDPSASAGVSAFDLKPVARDLAEDRAAALPAAARADAGVAPTEPRPARAAQDGAGPRRGTPLPASARRSRPAIEAAPAPGSETPATEPSPPARTPEPPAPAQPASPVDKPPAQPPPALSAPSREPAPPAPAKVPDVPLSF